MDYPMTPTGIKKIQDMWDMIKTRRDTPTSWDTTYDYDKIDEIILKWYNINFNQSS